MVKIAESCGLTSTREGKSEENKRGLLLRTSGHFVSIASAAAIRKPTGRPQRVRPTSGIARRAMPTPLISAADVLA
jgi:hypothetical protein